MDKEMMVQIVEKACPFAQRTGMRFGDADEGPDYLSLVMEDDPDNLNAFGLIHAGAICGLAETTGGMALMRYLDPREVMVLNTLFHIRFSHPPRGELKCTARVGEEEAKAVMDEYKREGRADKAMDLKVRDSDGTLVAHAQATFRLLKPTEEYRKYLGG